MDWDEGQKQIKVNYFAFEIFALEFCLGPKPLTTTVTPVLNRHPRVSQDCSFRTGVQ